MPNPTNTIFPLAIIPGNSDHVLETFSFFFLKKLHIFPGKGENETCLHTEAHSGSL